MTPDELREALARAISGAPFSTHRSRNKADAALAAIRDAGLAIVPAVPTDAMLQAGQQERDDNAHVSEVWGAMVKAAQEGTP
jgi:hypothetical protein